jgi:hypothetical protein
LEELATSLVLSRSAGAPAPGCSLATAAASPFPNEDCPVHDVLASVVVCTGHTAKVCVLGGEEGGQLGVVDMEARPDPTLVGAASLGYATVVATTDAASRMPSLIRPLLTDASGASPSESQRRSSCHSWSCPELIRLTLDVHCPHSQRGAGE